MHEKINEFKKDFLDKASMIDETAYNPTSTDFERALNIGLMWLVLNEFGEEQQEVFDDEYENVRDELMGSDKYYKMYLEDKNPQLKQMASQELSHALYWLNRLKLSDKTKEQQIEYDNLEEWYHAMLDSINK